MPYIERVIDELKITSPGQPEFYQAVHEVLSTIRPLLDKEPKYRKHKILERIVEPERQVMFRVAWQDDKGDIQVNKAYRVQFNSAVGPYKGGMRFHPSVNSGIIKFLGFEQMFKNALTGLAIGGGKGGSNFDPKGKSDDEVMRFCQALMTELYRFLGPTVDVPAGDIGVGAREIGYMYGQYKRLTHSHDGVITGKGIPYGGSLARKEATGYGVVYFALSMLKAFGFGLENQCCTISGSGNVAIYCAEKLYQSGALPISVSDSTGMVYHKEGINVAVLKQVKEEERMPLTRYVELCPQAVYTPVKDYPAGRNPLWSLPCDVAFPCATQNEINEADAAELVKNGCKAVVEGANMPSTMGAIDTFLKAGVIFGPAKAANAGGVATSQLEMAQNASMQSWDFETVDNKLKNIMNNAFAQSYAAAKEFNQPKNIALGANIAGFRKVADNMIALGLY